jgi:hypothetical protein
MAKQHIRGSFAALLLVSTIAAADVNLGPEVPLTRDFDNEPIGGDFVAATANGSDFLVVWQDSRSGSAAIRATRVDASGHPANPVGVLIGAGYSPLVARNGNGYIVVWNNGTQLWSTRVDANGNPIDSHQLSTIFGVFPAALLTTDSSFLLAYDTGYAVFDSAGASIRSTPLVSPGGFLGAAVRGSSYVAAWGPSNGNATLLTIAGDGSFSQKQFPVPDTGRAAFGDNSILVVTKSSYLVAGYDGTIVEPARSLLSAAARRLAAAWDGHEFLAVLDQKAFRVAADGTLIDAAPFPISSNEVRQFTFARGGASNLAAWTDGIADAALVGRAVPSFDALAAASEPPSNLALAPEPQIDAQIAYGGGTLCGVWSNPSHYEVHASFNGATITVDEDEEDFIGWPAVAAGNHGFLVVWLHYAFAANGNRVLARRFDFVGHPLDAAPVVIDTGGTLMNVSSVLPPAVGFDGSSFFVAWGREPGQAPPTLYSVRIGEDGQLHDRRETQTSASNGFTINRVARALWTGSQFVVVQAVEHLASNAISPTYVGIQTLRYEPATAAITQTTPAAFPSFSLTSFVGAALAPNAVTYAWPDENGTGINVAQTTVDGILQRDPRTLIKPNTLYAPTRIDLAWDGSNYVAVWLDDVDVPNNAAGSLRGLHFDRNLQPVESAPFEIFSGSAPMTPPRLVHTPVGLLLVYSRADLESGGSARTFTRSLTPPPRRHATH